MLPEHSPKTNWHNGYNYSGWTEHCNKDCDNGRFEVVQVNSNDWINWIKMRLAAILWCETAWLARSFREAYIFISLLYHCISGNTMKRIHPHAISLTCYLHCTVLSLQADGQRTNHCNTINSIPLRNRYQVLARSDNLSPHHLSLHQSPFLPYSAWHQFLTTHRDAVTVLSLPS